jgi:tRNA(Ile)-lysidine synthase
MPTPMVMDQGKDTALLDFKHIEQPVLLRKWKTGDYLYPIGMEMKKKKVSRMLINDKVPIHEKEHIMVLESNKRIAWIVGMRVDERFKVKPTTEKVLMVKRKLNPSPDPLKLGV